MLRDTFKRAGRRLLQPVTGRLDAVLARLDTLEAAVGRLQATSPVGDADRFEQVRLQLAELRDDVWHSKAVSVGDRLLVGSRHLGLVFLVDPADRLIGPRFVVDGEYEPETTLFVRNLLTPTSVCIDVGANFGYFTCLMAKLAWQGRTLSFEPDPQVHAMLRDNVYVNWCERVAEPANAAVGDQPGELTLFRRVGRSGNTSIVESTDEELAAWAEAPSERFTVPCVTLDEVTAGLDRVDLVKIDVEGAESMVVAGMGELVRRLRPTVVMEWSPWQTERAGFQVGALVESLAALDLVPHTLGPGGTTTPITFDQLQSLTYQNVVLRAA